MRVYFLLAGENSMRVWREKILCVFHNMTNYKNKKKDLKIRFFKHGAVVNTRRSVLTYLYIIYYIKERKDGNTLRG